MFVEFNVVIIITTYHFTNVRKLLIFTNRFGTLVVHGKLYCICVYYIGERTVVIILIFHCDLWTIWLSIL
jgi:hypothetical protein